MILVNLNSWYEFSEKVNWLKLLVVTKYLNHAGLISSILAGVLPQRWISHCFVMMDDLM